MSFGDPVRCTGFGQIIEEDQEFKHLACSGALEREVESELNAVSYDKVRAKPAPLICKGDFRERPHFFATSENQTAAPAGPRNGGGFCETLTKALDGEHTKALPQFQADFLASRFRLGADWARLVAEIAWGRSA